MKVIKFIKKKGSMYELHLADKRTVMVHEDLILQQDILLNKEINENVINDLERLNNNCCAYDMAVKFISRRYRSIYEVEKFLINKEIDRVIIEQTIKRLCEQKYLDDLVYAQAYINDTIKFSNSGPHKIRKDLEEKRVSCDIINQTLEAFDDNLEKERLEKLIPKYVKTVHNKSLMMLRNKVCEHFENLGYSKNIIINSMDVIDYDDKDIKEKEYQKIYKRLARKYSGTELDFKVKQALYQKGFK